MCSVDNLHQSTYGSTKWTQWVLTKGENMKFGRGLSAWGMGTFLCGGIVNRYDIKGKQYLTTGVKYYLADIGLRYFLLGSKKADEGHILENIVYLELLRRGYEVYIGKVNEGEVDFIAVNEKGEEYYQVAYTVREEKTLERELSCLESIKDHNPKYLLTMDVTPYTSHNGIKQINVLNWLLGREI